ncbi:replication initiation protein [Tortoise microvirus 21]|nr:replication initiation protein [Tortoise microvirus 21]
MRCTSPLTFGQSVENPLGVKIPCGRCMACRINKRTEWCVRLLHELEYWDHKASFITLTYDDAYLHLSGLVKRDLQTFFKRLRKRYKDIKYYAVGEYGEENLRPHYHAIVFGFKPNDLYFQEESRGRKRYTSKELDSIWKLGRTNVGVVEPDTVQYVCGYVVKKLGGDLANYVYGPKQRPFALISKGLGLRHVLDNKEKYQENPEVIRKGKRLALPRYYRVKAEVNPIKIEGASLKSQVKYAEELEKSASQTFQKQNEQREKNLQSRSDHYEK